MTRFVPAQAEVIRLRHDIARLEGRLAENRRLAEPLRPGAALRAPAALLPAAAKRSGARLALGLPRLEAALGGGLPLATLHEVRTAETRDGAAAGGFALALAARLLAARADAAGSDPAAPKAGGIRIVWISEADARRETGALYPPGLAALGLDPGSVMEVAARTPMEALWAFETALASPGLGMAVCELRRASLDLSATRRCAFRAHRSGVTGLILRLGHPEPEPSAADLRFALAPAPSGTIGGFAAGMGRMAWRLILEKNRLGRSLALTVEWDNHARTFAERGLRTALSQPRPAVLADRPAAARAEEGIRRAS